MGRFFRFGTFAFLIAIFFAASIAATSAYAKDGDNALHSKIKPEQGEKKGLVNDGDLEEMLAEPVPEYQEGVPQSKRQYIYEEPTIGTLSHLYWALGMMDYENDEHLDYFLRINECDIQQNYGGNEYEWKRIRNATRDFIKRNVKDFPTRFELALPVRLEEYDMKRKAFRIKEEDQIMAARRFELLAKDFSRMTCWIKSKEIPGYPKGLIIELSRPFSITYVPAPPDMALDFIKEKDAIFQSWTGKGKSKQRLYDLRTAYVILQLKIFAQRGFVRGTNALKFVRVMAVLEGFEIYGNPGHKDLFYSKSYLRKKDEVQAGLKLQRDRDILAKKALGEGILH